MVGVSTYLYVHLTSRYWVHIFYVLIRSCGLYHWAAIGPRGNTRLVKTVKNIKGYTLLRHGVERQVICQSLILLMILVISAAMNSFDCLYIRLHQIYSIYNVQSQLQHLDVICPKLFLLAWHVGNSFCNRHTVKHIINISIRTLSCTECTAVDLRHSLWH